MLQFSGKNLSVTFNGFCSQETGLVPDKHSYNENKQTYKRESITEN